MSRAELKRSVLLLAAAAHHRIGEKSPAREFALDQYLLRYFTELLLSPFSLLVFHVSFNSDEETDKWKREHGYPKGDCIVALNPDTLGVVRKTPLSMIPPLPFITAPWGPCWPCKLMFFYAGGRVYGWGGEWMTYYELPFDDSVLRDRVNAGPWIALPTSDVCRREPMPVIIYQTLSTKYEYYGPHTEWATLGMIDEVLFSMVSCSSYDAVHSNVHSMNITIHCFDTNRKEWLKSWRGIDLTLGCAKKVKNTGWSIYAQMTNAIIVVYLGQPHDYTSTITFSLHTGKWTHVSPITVRSVAIGDRMTAVNYGEVLTINDVQYVPSAGEIFFNDDEIPHGNSAVILRYYASRGGGYYPRFYIAMIDIVSGKFIERQCEPGCSAYGQLYMPRWDH